MNRPRVIVTSCLALAFGMLGSACTESSSSPPAETEEHQPVLKLSYEQISEPVLAYFSSEKTAEEIIEAWEAVSGESCRREPWSEEYPSRGVHCSSDSAIRIYDSNTELPQKLEEVNEYYEGEALLGYRLVGINWDIDGSPEVLEQLYQDLGGVQVTLGD